MRWLVICIIALNQMACSVNHVVKVGDEPVRIQQIVGKGKTYVHVHHNEQTALKAAKAVIHKDGGSLITLVHSGGRNIVFHLNNERYEFDPNRIYTDAGIKKTLTQYSHYTPEAHH